MARQAKGLTAATFADNVEYREESGKTSPARVARSRTPTVALADETISSAVLAGAVKLRKSRACRPRSGEARYDPMKASLRPTWCLKARGEPRVSDDRSRSTRAAIDVALEVTADEGQRRQ